MTRQSCFNLGTNEGYQFCSCNCNPTRLSDRASYLRRLCALHSSPKHTIDTRNLFATVAVRSTHVLQSWGASHLVSAIPGSSLAHHFSLFRIPFRPVTTKGRRTQIYEPKETRPYAESCIYYGLRFARFVSKPLPGQDRYAPRNATSALRIYRHGYRDEPLPRFSSQGYRLNWEQRMKGQRLYQTTEQRHEPHKTNISYDRSARYSA
jgi:hypothetical protein